MPASELAEAVVGTLIFTLGLVSIVFGVLPSRERTPLWLGLFASLYGIRLAADSELLRALFGYSSTPEWSTLIAWAVYLVVVLYLYTRPVRPTPRPSEAGQPVVAS